jgi:hypothetical protein
MRPYAVLITHSILSMPRPSARERSNILVFLESLSGNPFQKGDYEEKDLAGRPVHIKIIGKWALTFWADHAVAEVKVIRIEKADKT